MLSPQKLIGPAVRQRNPLSRLAAALLVAASILVPPQAQSRTTIQADPSPYASIQIATNELNLALLRGDAPRALHFLAPDFQLGQYQYLRRDLAWMRHVLPQQLQQVRIDGLKTTLSSVELKDGQAIVQSFLNAHTALPDGSRMMHYMSDARSVWVQTEAGWQLQRDEATFNLLLRLIIPPEPPTHIAPLAPANKTIPFPSENPFQAWATAYPSKVLQLVFSPDNEGLAIRTDNDGLWLASLKTGAALRTLKASVALEYVTYDWEGRLITSHPNTVSIRDPKTGALQRAIRIGGHYAEWEEGRAAISRDNRILLSGSRLLDFKTEQRLIAPVWYWASYDMKEFSPDGTLIGGGSDYSRARLWNVKDGKSVFYFEKEGWGGFQTDGKSFITTSPEALQLRSILTGTIERTIAIPNQKTANETLRFPKTTIAPNGRTAASIYSNGTIGIWDIQTGHRQHFLRGFQSDEPDGGVSALAFSPNSRLLAAANRSGETAIWNVGATGLGQK